MLFYSIVAVNSVLHCTFCRYVSNDLDDNDGKRTRVAIQNYHGIVKFELGKEFTLSEAEPMYWETVQPFTESTSFKAKLADGMSLLI